MDWTSEHLDVLSRWLRPGPKTTAKEAQVELSHESIDRDGTGVVAVLLNGVPIGRLPKKSAAVWRPFIDEQNRKGRRVLATARAWAYVAPGRRSPNISLYVDVPEDPATYAAAERAASWRAAGLCIECGEPVEKTGGRGSAIRCPVHAEQHRAGAAAAKTLRTATRVPTYRCEECGDEYADDQVAELGPLFECKRCELRFAPLASEGRSNLCPDCSRPCIEIAAHGCSGCGEGRVLRLTAPS